MKNYDGKKQQQQQQQDQRDNQSMNPSIHQSMKGTRLVERNLPFHQSRSVSNVRIIGIDQHHYWLLMKEDWFHVMLRLHYGTSSGYLLLLWTISLLVFAAIYQRMDDSYYGETECGLSTESYQLAFGGFFAFSLQTSTTVGYTLPSTTQAFFQNCPWIQFVIYAQMTFSMLFNAFLMAFVVSKISKAENRSSQVIMSNTCCIRTEGMTNNNNNNNKKKWILEVRIYDTDVKYPIVESHVRLYARTKSTHELIPLRLVSPTDETGAMMFLGVPCIVRHEIDVYSALHPSSSSSSSPKTNHPHHKYRLPGSGLYLREADSRSGNIQQIVCPICGESYCDMDRLRTHVQLVQLIEETSGYPLEGSHRSLVLDELIDADVPSVQQMKASFPEEILVVMEGIDPLTSGTFQGLHSYTMDDVSWGGRFANCLQHVVLRNPQTTTSSCSSTRVFPYRINNPILDVNFSTFHSVDVDDDDEMMNIMNSNRTSSPPGGDKQD
jgi:Inward rectifier potassium channel transmembrane domain